MSPLLLKLGGRVQVQSVEFVTFFLSLGTNIGDREAYLQEAVHLLTRDERIKLAHCSSIYETEPIGYTEQDLFLNIVLEGKTNYSPDKLLQVTQAIEQKLGRTREVRWGPRTIDIDILLYNNKRIRKEELIIPHPRMKERAFVMIPLAEIAGNLIMPGEVQSVEQLAAILPEEGVRQWKSPFLLGEDVFEPLES